MISKSIDDTRLEADNRNRQQEIASFWGKDVTQLTPEMQQILLSVIKKLKQRQGN